MKATALLREQHRIVEDLFAQVLKAENPEERMTLAEEIAANLEAHTALEEEIFYPAYREASGTKEGEELTLEAYEEHHVVKLVLAELPQIDASAETFEAKMSVLKELVEHHVEEEETEMFQDAEKKLGKERLEELGVEMEARDIDQEDGDTDSADADEADAEDGQDDGTRIKKSLPRNRRDETAAQDQPKNRKHTGGGEQNRRKPKGGDREIEKNPPRDGDGKTAQDKKLRQKSSRTA